MRLKGSLSKKININREELCNLYITKKISSAKIGKIFNCGYSTIIRRLRKFGIPIRPYKLDIKKEQLRVLYIVKRLSSIEIGKIFGCSNMTVMIRLRGFGIPVRSYGGARKLDIGRESLYNFYIKKKMSSIKIGKLFNCNNVVILDRLREFGIPIRSRSEAHKNLSPETLKRMLRRRMPSSLEERFQNIIDKRNLPYKYVGNGAFILGSYNPDFINTNSEKIAIEVFARYYKKRNKISIEEWKKKRTQVFQNYGWKLLFFNEIQVNEKNVLKVLR